MPSVRPGSRRVAWQMTCDGLLAKEYLERSVLFFADVVLRYGQFYGPGTYHEDTLPEPPRVHVDDAARRTVSSMTDTGVVVIADD